MKRTPNQHPGLWTFLVALAAYAAFTASTEPATTLALFEAVKALA